MKIKLINYNRTISHVGMSKVLIDEVKIVKSEDGDGSELLEVLFGNETGIIKTEYNLQTKPVDSRSLTTLILIQIRCSAK